MSFRLWIRESPQNSLFILIFSVWISCESLRNKLILDLIHAYLSSIWWRFGLQSPASRGRRQLFGGNHRAEFDIFLSSVRWYKEPSSEECFGCWQRLQERLHALHVQQDREQSESSGKARRHELQDERGSDASQLHNIWNNRRHQSFNMATVCAESEDLGAVCAFGENWSSRKLQEDEKVGFN